MPWQMTFVFLLTRMDIAQLALKGLIAVTVPYF
jgi:hypothetical protein